MIGYLGRGHVTKVIGIAAMGDSGLTYVTGTQPFNSNFASILFELREAGLNHVNSVLDYALANNRQLATPNGNFNANFLQSYRVSAGMAMAPTLSGGNTNIKSSHQWYSIINININIWTNSYYFAFSLCIKYGSSICFI